MLRLKCYFCDPDMPQKLLHIVSFDNPYPPVYGGVIDVFYKIKALHAQGYNIILHCFVDDISLDQSALKQYVSEVYFYKKKHRLLTFFSLTPLPVLSRFRKELYENINKIQASILFEGLQTTYILNKFQFPGRKIYLRLHNLETNYFKGLSRSETSVFKKILYRIEAEKHAFYEKILSKFDAVFTLSEFETAYVNKHFGNAFYIPVFHGNDSVGQLSEFGKYALYHGDLRMSDNKKAALFLIDVFREIPDYSLIIASSKGKKLIENEIKNVPNVRFSDIKNDPHLEQLLANAHISVMLSFQESGTKLKAANSLYRSRFCVINSNMIDDEKVKSLCTIAETKTDFINAINTLKNQPYLDSKNRSEVLSAVLNDNLNALKIKDIMK